MRILQALVFVLVAAAASSQTPAPDAIPAPPDVAAPPADAVKTASGLATKVIAPGTGKDRPAKDDVVTIHYTGWKTDGTMFDSSVARGKPASFPRRARDCRLQRRPAADGAGRKAPPLDSRSARLQRRARAEGHARVRHRADRHARPRAPADVKAPPADAKKTASGLAYKSLTPGHRRAASQAEQPGHRALHRLDDRREDVRQLGRARRAGDLPARRRDPGMDRRAAADGTKARRRASGFRRTWPTRARARRTACWCSTSSCIKIQ